MEENRIVWSDQSKFNDWSSDDDVGVYEFKPNLWQKIRLMFGPIYVGVDLGVGEDLSVECKFQKIDGNIVITDIKESPISPKFNPT